ncbi:MAG: epoxyqueuosine reductase QueH [Bacteroidales bacterium]
MIARDKIVIPSGERILLHACCAPCSSAIVEYLVSHDVRPVIFYSNSNITPRSEYEIRGNECVRYALTNGLEIVSDDYDHREWGRVVNGLEDEPERGARCSECFRFRLERAARYAHEHGFGVLATTLASSRWKDLDQVDAAGEYACGLFPDVTWWGQNWRKNGLQERRNQLIRENHFYNQLYCGCEFSLSGRDPDELRRIALQCEKQQSEPSVSLKDD